MKVCNNYSLVHLNHPHQRGQLHRLPSLTHAHNQTQFLTPERASLCERTRLTRERDPGCKRDTLILGAVQVPLCSCVALKVSADAHCVSRAPSHLTLVLALLPLLSFPSPTSLITNVPILMNQNLTLTNQISKIRH